MLFRGCFFFILFFAPYDSPLDQKKHVNETTFFLRTKKNYRYNFLINLFLPDVFASFFQQRQSFVFCFYVTGYRGIPSHVLLRAI